MASADGRDRSLLCTVFRTHRDHRDSRAHKTPPIVYNTPTNLLAWKALMQAMKPVWDQSLAPGRGGETVLQMQKAICMRYMRKNQAYVTALSFMAALYSRLYLYDKEINQM